MEWGWYTLCKKDAAHCQLSFDALSTFNFAFALIAAATALLLKMRWALKWRRSSKCNLKMRMRGSRAHFCVCIRVKDEEWQTLTRKRGKKSRRINENDKHEQKFIFMTIWLLSLPNSLLAAAAVAVRWATTRAEKKVFIVNVKRNGLIMKMPKNIVEQSAILRQKEKRVDEGGYAS